MKIALLLSTILSLGMSVAAQQRGPSSSARPFEVRRSQQIEAITKSLQSKNGNQQFDIVPSKDSQLRVAVFFDEKRENDNFEVHDDSDDIYIVLDGEATLVLGGNLTDAKEVSPGEWRSKTAGGGQSVKIAKGDVIVVPRGTVHQRSVAGKGFSMILIKVFRDPQP